MSAHGTSEGGSEEDVAVLLVLNEIVALELLRDSDVQGGFELVGGGSKVSR